MKRLRLAAALSAAALALSTQHAPAQVRPAPGAVSIEVQGTPFAAFEPRDKERRQFGALTFRSAVTLTSSFKSFGGISSLRIEAGGERFLAITDKGWWLRGRLTYAQDAPTGMAEVEMGPMLGIDGRPLSQRGWFDSESLALHGGTAYVGFERVHQILRFDIGRDGLYARGRPMAAPLALKSLPSNRSIEALAFVPKGLPLAGTLIAISERGLDEAGNIRGFLIGGATPGEFTVKRTDDFDVTDAAITSAGDLLVLERKFSLLTGPGMRIRRVPLARIAPDALVDGESLIIADAGYEIDNMEGLSVHVDARGRTILTLVSDDNFSSLQRTLLMQFTLTE